ncbi:MAG TPA: hypothetical protein VHO69_01605 [Phototrophicaceae bacterium]|nr:hypothetical protein [Phototrophicaceae bacterium]
MSHLLHLLVRLVAALLILIATGTALAQDNDSPPRAPIMEDVSILRDRLAWRLDGKGLWFETGAYSSIGQAFEYHPETGQLLELEQSPFVFMPTEEDKAIFQSKGIVFHSPFETDIIYESTLTIRCGYGCPGGLIMGGQDERGSEEPVLNAIYKPLDLFGQVGIFGVWWSRDEKAAVVLTESPYDSGDGLFYVRLQDNYDVVPMGWADGFENSILAISEDASRILYTAGSGSLVLWQVEFYSSEGVSLTNTNKQRIAVGNVVGAAFTPNTDEILYIGGQGLTRYILETNYSEVINQEINSDGVVYAVFSPDNRYVALISDENGLYVVPTGINS